MKLIVDIPALVILYGGLTALPEISRLDLKRSGRLGESSPVNFWDAMVIEPPRWRVQE
jgi:hypothetical protein